MTNKKIVNFRIKPYVQEATVQIAVDILIMVITLIVLTFVKIPLIASFAVIMCYFSIALILHYRVVINAMIDKQKCDYITETVRIKYFDNEYSFAGDRFGNSNIRFFYPKELQVWRYKINVINSRSEEKKLRTVMSFRRFLKFVILDKHKIEYLQVTYLKKSKILIHVDLIEDIKKIESNKKLKEIKNAIQFINTSI